MSIKSVISPIQEPQQFGDHGFDPRISSFQVLEGGKKQKRENSEIKNKMRRWWKNALIFFKNNSGSDLDHQVHRVDPLIRSIFGPVYSTESRMVSCTPYRAPSRLSFGPPAGVSTPDEVGMPYISLGELNMDQQYH